MKKTLDCHCRLDMDKDIMKMSLEEIFQFVADFLDMHSNSEKLMTIDELKIVIKGREMLKELYEQAGVNVDSFENVMFADMLAMFPETARAINDVIVKLKFVNSIESDTLGEILYEGNRVQWMAGMQIHKAVNLASPIVQMWDLVLNSFDKYGYNDEDLCRENFGSFFARFPSDGYKVACALLRVRKLFTEISVEFAEQMQRSLGY